MQVSKNTVNTVRKPATGQLLNIEEYLAAKGLTVAGKKPVLTLVPKVEPSKAEVAALALVKLRHGIVSRNSRLMNEAAGFYDDCEPIPTTACSGERTQFRLPPDDEIRIKRYLRYRGGSDHHGGRKPINHIKFLRKE